MYFYRVPKQANKNECKHVKIHPQRLKFNPTTFHV